MTMTKRPLEEVTTAACPFEKLCDRSTWIFGPGKSRSMDVPRYGAGQQGIPKGPPRAIRRCPLCGKRLRLRANYCIGGEWTNWRIPDHKPRETRAKSPRRQSQAGARGH
jgi:hypothetical protein